MDAPKHTDVSALCPDIDQPKPVFLRASGPDSAYKGGERHVALVWDNIRMTSRGTIAVSAEQVIQLLGAVGVGGWELEIIVKLKDTSPKVQDEMKLLGVFSRSERDALLDLARKIPFEVDSKVNSCRTWTRDYLEAVVEAGLPLTRERFKEIEWEIPLLRRLPEI